MQLQQLRRVLLYLKIAPDIAEGLLEQRRLSPHQDVMSRFLAAEVDGVHPSEREIVACCRLLLAGQQLLTNLLGNAMFCLLEHPEDHGIVVDKQNFDVTRHA